MLDYSVRLALSATLFVPAVHEAVHLIVYVRRSHGAHAPASPWVRPRSGARSWAAS